MLLVVVGLTTEGCPSNVESDNTKKVLNAVKRMIYLGNAKQYIQHPCRMQGEVQIKLPREDIMCPGAVLVIWAVLVIEGAVLVIGGRF